MIIELRRRHRWLAPLAFLFAGAALATGLAYRPTRAAATQGATKATELGAGADDAPIARDLGGRLHAVARGAATSAGAVRLLLVPEDDLAAPDLLAYAASSPGDEERLPDDARLLGSVAPVRATALDVPLGTSTLIVYSLGHQRRVATLDVGAWTAHGSTPATVQENR